jgi:hypothetical protein
MLRKQSNFARKKKSMSLSAHQKIFNRSIKSFQVKKIVILNLLCFVGIEQEHNKLKRIIFIARLFRTQLQTFLT